MQLTQSQINERVSVLKRFRQLLEQQREKFQQYLLMLEAQEKSIDAENADTIAGHAKLGESLVAEITNIQKVIDPIENMYNDFYAGGFAESEKQTVLETQMIKKELHSLQENILVQNEKNRDKLKTHLIGLRKQVADLKTLPRTKKLFAKENTAEMIDVQV